MASSDLDREFSALSIRDLLDARDQYHLHLMRHPHVVATAVGYYRIRSGDSLPGQTPVVKGTGERTLANSEIRSYSWPAVLVFVEKWEDAAAFGGGGAYDPDGFVPKTLYLPDGRRIPVCVIEAPKDPQSLPGPDRFRYPLNNIGSGNPVNVTLQEREHVATVACLVTDGHKSYALTNRHVTGEAGQEITSRLGATEKRIGVSAPLHETRVLMSEVYPGWAGRSVFVNLDVGLIDIDDLNDWTARLKDGEVMGKMVDLSSAMFPLSLVGSKVKGWGAASGMMEGEIHALFYRYKSVGGFEYVADFFIGPRGAAAPPFATAAGDSGTLWLLEPSPAPKGQAQQTAWRPLAIQWGANRLYSALDANPQAYVLATCLSTVCERLDIDIIRDWNLDQPDTWGAVGHFAIASRAAGVLSGAVPRLAELMDKNTAILTRNDATILSSDFKGMGDASFVPLADVPDFYWKHGKQGASRPLEGPNHFSDMDQKDAHHKDLLALCEDAKNIDPAVWNSFYSSVKDLGNGKPITQQHRGLLPFRVWQIFNEMVKQAGPHGDLEKFVCAAGVLAHYIGDACQPLHISYLHDGDPLTGHKHTVHHIKGGTDEIVIPAGAGVHSAYEDQMVNSHRKQILKALDKTPKVDPGKYISDGKAAAEATIALMRATFGKIAPKDIVEAFIALPDKKNAGAPLWKKFGADTEEVMQDGVSLLALLWESAWVKAGGEAGHRALPKLTQSGAMKICADENFIPSCSIEKIKPYL